MRVLAHTLILFASFLLPSFVFGQVPDASPQRSSNDFGRNISISQLLDDAQTSLRKGDLTHAVSALRKAIALEEGNKAARKALIQALLMQGNLKEAEEQVQTFGRLHPEEIDAMFLRAVVAFQSGNLRLASESAEACLKRGGARAETHKLLAMAEYLQGHFPQFETHIREASKLDPLDPDPHYHLGRYYFEDKRYALALEAFQKACSLQPDHYKSHYYAGLVYEGQNDIDAAKRELQEAVRVIDRLKVRYAWPYADLGRLLVNEDDFDRGVGWLYRAIRNDPESPYARYQYAKALFRKEATSEVKQELTEAIRLDPGYSDAYYLLARYYQKTGAKELAKEFFAKFEEVKKNSPPSPFGVRR